ncbi:glycoside hydrolase [Opitutaceae bacterium TAV4]|nr:glycoside hydrolase [Opitutaceae bacterium TAV4]RRK02283.1 glycoside hydrolase [Opitutaceae bacterium TAV3]
MHTKIPHPRTLLPLAAAILAALVPSLTSGQSAPTGDAQVQAEHEAIGISTKTDTTIRTTHPDAQWFPDAALGLFIHWGTSSVRAMNLSNIMVVGNSVLREKRISDPSERARIIREKDYNMDGKGPPITPNEYWTMAKDFNPQAYDPDKWLAAAKDAGFTYAVLTTKHHEGFAMWPSDVGDFNTRTYMGGKDLVRDYVDACRRHGLKVGLYFSGPDWYFDRNYKNFLAPRAVRNTPEFFPLGPDLEPRTSTPAPAELAVHQAAYARLVRTQIEELLTRYGKIDLLWFDGKPEMPNGENVISIERIRELQPGIVVNPRLTGSGDFVTFERWKNFPSKRPTGWAEFCDTGWTNSWAFEDQRYRSTVFVIGYLARSRAWGMNFLLNVGPMSTGELPPEIYENMGILANWMKANRASIHGSGPLPGGETASVPATANEANRYMFAIPEFKPPYRPYAANLQPPRNETLTLQGLKRRVTSVTLLASGQKLDFEFSGGVLRVKLPASLRTDLVDVVHVKCSR